MFGIELTAVRRHCLLTCALETLLLTYLLTYMSDNVAS